MTPERIAEIREKQLHYVGRAYPWQLAQELACDIVPELLDQLEDAQNRNAMLSEKLEAATSKKYTCMYCGESFNTNEKTIIAAIWTEHINTCPQHPLRAAEAEIAHLRDMLAGGAA